MRKFVLVVLILTLLFSGCSQNPTQNTEGTSTVESDSPEKTEQQIKITHESREDWVEFGTLDDQTVYDLVGTEDRALAIANAILAESIAASDEIAYGEVNIWEDVERQVWVISYYPQSTDPEKAIVGGAIHIAIRKHDAKVVNIWGEE